jgi:anaerobic selenocysteine-containing dehydrogenase
MTDTDTVQTEDGTYPTTCWECSTCCGALATVRDGRVVEFAPNRDHPYSKGAFCIKGIRGAPGITYGAGRLLHPMRRAGARGEGKWARVSWDEALEEMAERLAQVRQKYGPEAIVGATSGAYFSRSLILALTLRSIGSPNWMINQDLCGGCRAVSARAMGLNITRGEDIENTRCALIVGRNPSIADPVEWAALKAAKKRGARMIVIDPKRTQAAQMADLWLAPRVGTDAALALAMIHVLIAEGRYDQAFDGRRQAADALLESGRDVGAVRPLLRQARRFAVEGLSETRAAVHALRDEPVALTEQLSALADAEGADVTVAGNARALPPEVGLALYRAGQEALSNARKHAPGAAVSLCLTFEPGATVLVITNGPARAGITNADLARSGSGFGLRGMRERIELLGGDFRAEPHERGYTVRVTVPA